MRCTNTKSLCRVLFGVSIHSVIFFFFAFTFHAQLITIFCLSIIDQMGVELGKVLAKNILAQLDKAADVVGHDSSVSYLIALMIFFLI